MVSFADGDFVDGDLPELVQVGLSDALSDGSRSEAKSELAVKAAETDLSCRVSDTENAINESHPLSSEGAPDPLIAFSNQAHPCKA